MRLDVHGQFVVSVITPKGDRSKGRQVAVMDDRGACYPIDLLIPIWEANRPLTYQSDLDVKGNADRLELAPAACAAVANVLLAPPSWGERQNGRCQVRHLCNQSPRALPSERKAFTYQPLDAAIEHGRHRRRCPRPGAGSDGPCVAQGRDRE